MRGHKAFLGMGARLLDEAEVDLDEGSDPAHPGTGHRHVSSPSSWAAAAWS